MQALDLHKACPVKNTTRSIFHLNLVPYDETNIENKNLRKKIFGKLERRLIGIS